MTEILLTRHGHVHGITPERFRGRADIPLTAEGLAQAAALGQRINRRWLPSAIYVSPLGRCVATGDAIAKATGAQSRPLNALLDIDYGDWQWRTFDEVAKSSPAQFDLWLAAPHLMRFPKGESLQDLFARAADAIRFVIDNHSDGDTVVLVGHDSVNKAILLQALGLPAAAYWKLIQAPCALNELEFSRTHSRVITVNDFSHISSVRPANGAQDRPDD